jgi:probable rRNA maturation factor
MLVSEKTMLRDLHVIIVDDVYITRLNSEFFSRNRPTNVISFDLDDVREIYVSCDQARDDDDLYYFIAHGLMHLIGYTHDDPRQEKIMNDKCTNYLRVTGIHMSARRPSRPPEHGTK